MLLMAESLFFFIQIFLAAIAVVQMEPQWPLLQPTVPYVYGAYPVYHQVRVVPWTKSVASLAYSFKAKNGLENLSAEGCSVVTEFQEVLSKGKDFFKNDRKTNLFLHFRVY